MDEKTAGDLFHVGPIFVDVGYTDCPEARTNDGVLGAVDLGGEIVVRLYEYGEYGDEDGELDPDPPDGSVGMWKMLLTQMRDMLARCLMFGRMHPMWRGSEEEEGYKEFNQAAAELGEDFFNTTPGTAVAALRERAREDENTRAFWEGLGRFMEAQQERPDENITLGDAVERHKERTDEVRKIVEGEEAAEDK
jgi:hypothetical protein